MPRRVWLLRVEAVRKRPTCVIAPFQHARKRLGEPLSRYTRLRGLMDFIEVVSKVVLQMRVAARCAWFIRNRGAYALIACISGTMPRMCITRLRL